MPSDPGFVDALTPTTHHHFKRGTHTHKTSLTRTRTGVPRAPIPFPPSLLGVFPGSPNDWTTTRSTLGASVCTHRSSWCRGCETRAPMFSRARHICVCVRVCMRACVCIRAQDNTSGCIHAHTHNMRAYNHTRTGRVDVEREVRVHALEVVLREEELGEVAHGQVRSVFWEGAEDFDGGV